MKRSCLVAISVACLVFQGAYASVLFQDGFDYTSGGILGGNGGWSGSSSTAFTIGSANLTYPNLTDLGGNDVGVTSGSSTSITNIFDAGISSGSVYFSFLISSTTLPTSGNAYLVSLNPATAKPNGGSDALAVYSEFNGAGYSLGIRTSGGGSAVFDSADVLSANTTYLAVVQYDMSISGSATANLYLNPVPGGSQPGIAAATVTTATPLSIGDVGIKAQSATTFGNYTLDNFIIGTTWDDVVAPIPEPTTLALAGLGLLGLALRLRRR